MNIQNKLLPIFLLVLSACSFSGVEENDLSNNVSFEESILEDGGSFEIGINDINSKYTVMMDFFKKEGVRQYVSSRALTMDFKTTMTIELDLFGAFEIDPDYIQIQVVTKTSSMFLPDYKIYDEYTNKSLLIISHIVEGLEGVSEGTLVLTDSKNQKRITIRLKDIPRNVVTKFTDRNSFTASKLDSPYMDIGSFRNVAGTKRVHLYGVFSIVNEERDQLLISLSTNKFMFPITIESKRNILKGGFCAQFAEEKKQIDFKEEIGAYFIPLNSAFLKKAEEALSGDVFSEPLNPGQSLDIGIYLEEDIFKYIKPNQPNGTIWTQEAKIKCKVVSTGYCTYNREPIAFKDFTIGVLSRNINFIPEGAEFVLHHASDEIHAEVGFKMPLVNLGSFDSVATFQPQFRKQADRMPLPFRGQCEPDHDERGRGGW